MWEGDEAMHAMINAEEVLRRLKNQTINYDKVLRKMIVKWEAQKTSQPSSCILVVRLVRLPPSNFSANTRR